MQFDATLWQPSGETNWVLGEPNSAAARLGLNRTTLRSKMRKLGISRQATKTSRGRLDVLAEHSKVVSRCLLGLDLRMFKRTMYQHRIVDSNKILHRGGGHKDASDGGGAQNPVNELAPVGY